MMRGLRWLRLRRIADVIVVLAALPVLVPLGSVALALVFLYDRHNPLVHLPRSGRGGDIINVTKIRSMTPTSVRDDQSITASSDSRITPVGDKLRGLRLDEIPQVFHVLGGSMALIGPRPEAPEFVDMQDPLWQAALSARPAIAGLTQVIASEWEATQLNGHDAGAKYREIALPAKLAIDAWYVENCSPSLDFLIVRSLALHLLKGESWTPCHDLVSAQIPQAAPLLAIHPEAS